MSVLLCSVHPHSTPCIPTALRASPQLSVHPHSSPCIPTALSLRSTQASIFACTASAYGVSTGPIFFPWVNTFSFILIQALRFFSWNVPSSAAWHPASCQGISLCLSEVWLSFIAIGICWHIPLVKFTCTNLASFSLIKHFVVQLFT